MLCSVRLISVLPLRVGRGSTLRCGSKCIASACACNILSARLFRTLRNGNQMAVTDTNILQTPDGLKYFAPEREAAWIGILQAHSELTRALDAARSNRHGLSLSGYEVLSRLAHAEGGHLRMSLLAERSQLSLS